MRVDVWACLKAGFVVLVVVFGLMALVGLLT